MKALPVGLARLSPNPAAWRAGLLALTALWALLPYLTNLYWTAVANLFGIYVLLGLSLNLIVGEAGMFNLGHAAFYAIGAYTTAILNTQLHIPTLLLLPVSFAAAALVAAVLTRPILHLRGDYLCIVTIGFGEIVRLALTNNLLGLTGGPNGIFGIGSHSLGPLTIRLPHHYFYLIWSVVALAIVATVRLQRSRIGRAWNFIREDETAAEALGIDTVRMKLLAFIIGAGMAGVAGNLYAGRMTVIGPERFNFWESVVIFSIVVLGGPGSIPGVVLGSFAMWVLPELFRGFVQARMLVFGAAMMLMMAFRPQGLWPSAAWSRAVRMYAEFFQGPAEPVATPQAALSEGKAGRG